MSTTILRGGRVIDPAAGTETIADVVVRDGTVAEVSAVPVLDAGATVVDVTGLVVGPGFVDLHSHVHSIAGQRVQAFDGVTTNLDLEAGLMPIERAYAEAAAAGRVLNYGFSASWADARGQVLAGIEPTARFESLDGPARHPRLAAQLLPRRARRLAGAARARARRRRARDRRPDGLRAALGPGGVRRGRAARGRRRSTDVHPRARAGGVRPDHADRRLQRGRDRRRRDRRRDAPLPRQQHLAPPRRPGARHPRGRPRRRVAGHRRGLPVRHGQHQHRRVLPRPRAAARLGPDPVQHRDDRHRRADRRRPPARGAPRASTRARPASSSSSTSATRRTARCSVARSPSPTRSSPATRCRWSGRTTAATPASGRCRPAPPPTRAPRARSPAACG